ncbi:M15 family metallopeptidase [uncultured Anaerofustis sp.]|uniref:M15 family metallopeptidase n=1 Tax=uncultured Anaerofustis sp. TaxID=904996 RepID=UPI0025EA49DF|nr:M15 family metallopeptidase [uncultured Anaerofustis sp.]
MKRLCLDKNQVYSGELILVNGDNPIKKMISNKNISLVDKKSNVYLNKTVDYMLKELLFEIGSRDEIIYVSGYRTLGEQIKIYNDSIVENGEFFTNKYVALSNHSEHQTGLAIDLARNDINIDFIRPDFPLDGIYKEFREKAPHYGFIERYLKDKENITKISAEPWHFRYVGFPHSEIISRNNFVLEEYIEYIKDFKYSKKPLTVKDKNLNIEISYICCENDKNWIAIPDNSPYTVSGNNIDGYILTLWRT